MRVTTETETIAEPTVSLLNGAGLMQRAVLLSRAGTLIRRIYSPWVERRPGCNSVSKMSLVGHRQTTLTRKGIWRRLRISLQMLLSQVRKGEPEERMEKKRMLSRD